MKGLALTVPVLVALLFASFCSASEPKVTITYEENAQFEITSSTGQRILIDVYKPDKLSKPAGEADVLLTTHTHSDHVSALTSKFPGTSLMASEGEITLPGIHILGIRSSHSQDEPDGRNFIYLIEVDGLRIVHFGDVGQSRMTPEQMEKIGRVDVAITQFYNPLSSFYATNRKGFLLMQQVNPGLIIPTHTEIQCSKLGAEMWGGVYSPSTTVRVSRSMSPSKPLLVLLGSNAAPCLDGELALPAVTWND